VYDINFLILIFLVALAAIDLMVGVANDAVNFLNSAIGANVAPLRTILIVAAIGVFVGVLMSNGMMEIARKGIFNPQYFYMPELMIIFVAVMFQDIILLDTFNTFGLPTSTTVSIVFGLFGSATAMSIIKIYQSGDPFTLLFDYIEFENVFVIISGIVLSIVIAFVVGAAIQFITRMIFSFDYTERFKKWGPIWAGLALTSLSMFLLFKGAKNSDTITDFIAPYLYTDDLRKSFNVLNILAASGVIALIWTVILYGLNQLKSFSSLRFIVLFGTFSLALAFAANDLVNFIGAPIAGITTYDLAMQMPEAERYTTGMSVLATKIPAPSWMLLIAGGIMVTTLFFNKKAYSVAKTTINLSRQSDGYERFESNGIARLLVRTSVNIGYFVNNLLSPNIKKFLSKQFDETKYRPDFDEDGNKPAFDLLRAAVILMVAAALISVATLMKLPLSTTYVTFIVAMAAALPDKAWGRESSVYRVSGVVTVVGGWFVTAIGASIIAGLIATIIYFGEIYALLGFAILVAVILYRTKIMHRNRENSENERELAYKFRQEESKNVLDFAYIDTSKLINDINISVTRSINGLVNEDLDLTKSAKNESVDFPFAAKKINSELLSALKYTDEEFNLANDFSVALGDLRVISGATSSICGQNYYYVNNTHDPLIKEQMDDLIELDVKLEEFLNLITKVLKDRDFIKLEKVESAKLSILKKIKKLNKNQLKRIKKSKSKIRRSMLVLSIYSDVELIIEKSVDLTNSYGRLYEYTDFEIQK
jgi:phosphate/sulfate permease